MGDPHHLAIAVGMSADEKHVAIVLQGVTLYVTPAMAREIAEDIRIWANRIELAAED